MSFPWTRWLPLLGISAGLLCALFILQYTRFPFEPYRLYIFEYLFRTQDLPAARIELFFHVGQHGPRVHLSAHLAFQIEAAQCRC